MADPKPEQAAGEEALLELAEALALGEPVPAHLASLWERVGRDPEALARLGDLRDWWTAMREASREAEPPGALLILAVARGVRPRLELLRAEGWARPVLTVDAQGRTHVQTVAEGILRVGELEISAEAQPESLAVRIQGARDPNTVPEIIVYDTQGNILDQARANVAGVARLRTASADPLRLAIFWPERGPTGHEHPEIQEI